eukprot:1162055-Pelagomonas_calceolata.AAC.6
MQGAGLAQGRQSLLCERTLLVQERLVPLSCMLQSVPRRTLNKHSCSGISTGLANAMYPVSDVYSVLRPIHVCDLHLMCVQCYKSVYAPHDCMRAAIHTFKDMCAGHARGTLLLPSTSFRLRKFGMTDAAI